MTHRGWLAVGLAVQLVWQALVGIGYAKLVIAVVQWPT
jgi:hypothetical protein